MTETDTDRLTVDIWSDVMCPWCAIGFTQFSKAVAELAGDVDVEARFMPFELQPDMAPEGRNHTELLAEKYQKTAAELAEMRANLEAAGENAGFAMTYSGEGDAPPQMAWNSHEAHKLLRWALTVGDEAGQAKLKLALFRAHFQQRRNVSDREVLLDIAAAEGFDREAASAALDDDALSIAVKMEEKRGIDNGIRSVPTFVVNGKYMLQGSAQPEEFKQALTKIASMEAMA